LLLFQLVDFYLFSAMISLKALKYFSISFRRLPT